MGESTVGRPILSVVVPVFNSARTIGPCIESVLAAARPFDGADLIIVDNGSTDASREIVSRYPVRCLSQPKRGAAAARNAGVRAAAGELIAFIDSDCIADRAWLSEFVGGMLPGVACAGGMIAAPPATNDFEAYCNEFTAKSQENAIEGNAVPYPYINTANALFRREVFDAVGWFDEKFTWAGGEDIDFGWRVHWAGYAMRYLPGARVEHRHRSGPGQLFRSYYRYGRGWSMTVRKHSRRIQAMPPTIAGLGVGDVQAILRAFGHGAWNVLSFRDRRERRYGYYRVLRQLGDCCGRVAAWFSG